MAWLANKRCVLVESLSITDTLLATNTSEDIIERTVECPAKPRKIEAEAGAAFLGDNRDALNTEVKDFTSEDAPCRLHLHPQHYPPKNRKTESI